MRALLDVNLLLALLDQDHVFHQVAREWLAVEIHHGWASCPITTNGFVRIVSQPAYPSPVSIAEAIRRVGLACATPHHEFWPCSVSLLDPLRFDPTRLHGSRQVTDAYLLALAVERGGRLVTFDRSVALSAVRGATARHLTVLGG